jgi:toxin-antitoxin system PIN domain toxin
MSGVVIDVNILVAAFWRGHQFHEPARKWLSESLDAGELGVPDVVWSGFIRIIANPKIISPAAPWAEIHAFIDGVRRHKGYRGDIRGMTAPIETFALLCETTHATVKMVSDIYIAMVAIDHAASVATYDKDFDAYPVPVIHPPLV